MESQIGKYIIKKILGSGSFGDVSLALDPDLQKHIAIKKLKARPKAQREGEPQVDAGLLFRREAQDIAKLNHSNIITLFGLGVDENDGAPYVLMELLEGETLEQLIRNRTDIPLVEKIEIMRQVAEGLHYAHTLGVIHRDIKPANIMVLSNGDAKVMDFAVAPDGFIIGTLAYMAPEQFEGHSSDVLTDVFGFGAVYYEFVTGQRAFDPEAPERCQNSRSYEPPAVRMLVENCPAWLDHQIGRLLAKRRDTRLASLGEMLIDTRPALQKLKKERANELASGIAPLINAGDPEAANLLIEQVFRLDETNQEARTQRGRLQSAQREQARALARELVQRGEAEFADGEVEKAYRTFAEALELDIGNATIEKLVDKAQNKLEDCRTAQRLVNEVNDDLAAAGSAGMPGWQVERVFGLITRATRLDEYNREAARLRSQLHAVYQEVCDWRIGSRSATDETIPGGEWSEWYERCLIDARKARKNRDFDYAQEILSKLLASASDDRVQRELNAVAEDREAHHAAETARFWAADWKRRGNPEAALHVLDEFAERYPRRAKAVEDDRRMLEKELNPVTSHENSE